MYLREKFRRATGRNIIKINILQSLTKRPVNIKDISPKTKNI